MTSKALDTSITLSILTISLISLSLIINAAMQETIKTQTASQEEIEDTTTTSSTTTTTSTEPDTTPETKTVTSSTTTSTEYFEAECFVNTDCATNGTHVSREYMCYNGDIFRQYTHYRCENPGTRKAICVGTEAMDLVKKCGAREHCLDGEPFCEYTDDIDRKEASWRPGGMQSLDLSNDYERTYKGYGFTIVYVVSENSEPNGVMVDVYRPDGEETWEYIAYGRGTRIDKLNIGVFSITKKRFDINANVWIQEL